jgi:hypothetical protein
VKLQHGCDCGAPLLDTVLYRYSTVVGPDFQHHHRFTLLLYTSFKRDSYGRVTPV